MAAQGQLDSGGDRPAESKALIQTLLQGKGKSVLLVTDDDGAALSIVVGAAHALASGNAPKGLKRKRIIDLRALRPSGKQASDNLAKLERLFVETASVKEIILLLPPVAERSNAKHQSRWLELLRTTLESSNIQCICRTSKASYKNWIENDRNWKRIAHLMFVQESSNKDVPWEL